MARNKVETGPVNELVRDPVIQKEFGITEMTLSRWTADERMGFPPPIKINGRNYRSRRQIEDFKERLLRTAIAERGKKREARHASAST